MCLNSPNFDVPSLDDPSSCAALVSVVPTPVILPFEDAPGSITLPLARLIQYNRAPRLRRAAADFVDRLFPLPFVAAFFWPWAIVPLVYDLFADSRGASVGKRLLGLRTVIVSPDARKHGQPCTLGRSLLRNGTYTLARLCYLVPVLLPFGLAYDLGECLLAAFSPAGRRLGDLIAGTQVIAAESTGRREVNQ